MRPLGVAFAFCLFAAAISVIVFVFISPRTRIKTSDVEPAASSTFRTISVRDAVLDAKILSQTAQAVRIRGEYSSIGNLLYAPDHSPGDNASVSLWTGDAPRDVRAYFLDCSNQVHGQPSFANYCPVWVTGHFTTCYLKIAAAATFPCLRVERVETAR